jgi:prevent-host-death family protein
MSDKAKPISTTELTAQVSRVVNEVAFGGETFTVLRHGKPVAVVMPVADAERIRKFNAEKPSKKQGK